MPKIQTYERRVENPGVVQGRRMTAEDVGGGEGLAMLGRGLATASDALMQREAQIETSDLSAKMAKLQADKQIEWGDALRKADPNDRDLAKRFTADFDKAAEELGANISTTAGRKFFEERKSQLGAHFATTTNAGMVELAAVKAGQDFQIELNSYSTSVRADPTAYESNLNGLLAGLNARVKSGALPRETALKLETASRAQLAKNTVQGWIEKDPAFAKKQLDSGKWDTQFDADVKQQMYGQVDAEVRGREAEAARMRAEQERLKKEAQQQTQNQFLDKMQKGTLTWKEVSASNLDAFGSGSKEQFVQLMKARAEKPMKTDPRVFRDILDRIHAPETNPKRISDDNEITSYAIKGLLDVSDLKFLRDEFQGRGTTQGRIEADAEHAFLEGQKGGITKSALGALDVAGDQKFYEFKLFVMKQRDAQRKAGKPVEDLFNPKKPEYLGNYVRQFTPTLQERSNKMVENMGTAKKEVPARLPGETPADFAKRLRSGK